MLGARVSVLATVSLASSFALSSPALADSVKVGIRGGYYSQVDEPFLGAEVLVRVGHRLYFDPNVEYVFVSDGSYLTFNADFHYDFVVDPKTFVWLGAGLGVVHTGSGGARIPEEPPESGKTDAAANILGGIGVRAGSLVPYFQAKLIAKSGAIFAVAVGLRF